VLQTLQVVLHEGGVRELWRGTGPTVVRLSVGAGINFVVLERLKHLVLDVLPHTSGQLGYLQAAAVGGGTCRRPHQTSKNIEVQSSPAIIIQSLDTRGY